jgi:hypothetical protein
MANISAESQFYVTTKLLDASSDKQMNAVFAHAAFARQLPEPCQQPDS